MGWPLLACNTTSEKALPMLPHTMGCLPEALSIKPISVTIVLFPFVPVIEIISPLENHEASSISLIRGIWHCLAIFRAAELSLIPGLTITIPDFFRMSSQ